jgi:hypothetical protein
MEAITVGERRRAPRRVPEASEVLARVRLRGGRELFVSDVSPFGALLEGDSRLLPNTHVDVHVTTRQGRILVRARVMRVAVCRLHADVVTYRAAVAFEGMVDTTVHGYSIPKDE